MRTHKWIASTITGSVLLTGPLTSFAAAAEKRVEPADAMTEEEIIQMIDEAPAKSSMDGRGGGYGIMPPMYGGGVQVDALVTQEVTPDFIALNAFCNSGKQPSREAARTALEQVYQTIKKSVGNDGRIRKSGSIPVYPFYGAAGEDTGSYTAEMNLLIRITNVSAAQRISDDVEAAGCGVNWDVRLVDTQEFELSVVDELTSRLNKRKVVFEKILGKKLNTVIGATLNTWADGYGTYDPLMNKVDATSTLSVSYDLGKSATPASSAGSTRRTNTKTAPSPRG